jgi:methionine-rich copper-binding protein CopC
MFSHSSSRRPLGTVMACIVGLSFAFGAALVTSVISAAPASAHAVLVKITPAADAKLTTAPSQVVVEFNETVGSTFAAVVVTNAAGVSLSSGKPTALGGKVTQALSPEMASGDYRVAYRVTSDDGHPVSGESKFTVTLAAGTSPATAAAAPSASPSAANPSVAATATHLAEGPTAEQGGWLAQNLFPVAGAVGLLIIGAGLLLWERRRR